MRADSPRHIRDIAHLYLSRANAPRHPFVRLLVAGVNPDSVPAFHAANLALAAAATGARVRIVDASGLPVNAGCFLGLDPRCWVADGRAPAPAVSAFERVSFTRSSNEGEPAVAPQLPGADEDDVEIVHLPPWDCGAAHARMVMEAASGAAVLLYLAEHDTPPHPWLAWREIAGIRPRVAMLSRAGDTPAGCAGVLTRWKPALADPLPVVVRDPGSSLARQYRDLLANLLAAADRPARHRSERSRAGSPV